MHDLRRRFWLELALAILSAGLLVVTVVWHDWIEIVFRVDPDRGSGWFEWLVVALTFVVSVSFSISARREWRRINPHDSLKAPAV
jgi:hypothetical protein